MSRGAAAPHPGDATPQLGDPRFTFTLSFHSPRPPRTSIQKSARSRTAHLRVSKMAAEVAYKRERCAAHPGTSILTLVTQRLPPLSPPLSSLDSSLYFMRSWVGTTYRQQSYWRELQPTAISRELIRKRIARGTLQSM